MLLPPRSLHPSPSYTRVHARILGGLRRPLQGYSLSVQASEMKMLRMISVRFRIAGILLETCCFLVLVCATDDRDDIAIVESSSRALPAWCTADHVIGFVCDFWGSSMRERHAEGPSLYAYADGSTTAVGPVRERCCMFPEYSGVQPSRQRFVSRAELLIECRGELPYVLLIVQRAIASVVPTEYVPPPYASMSIITSSYLLTASSIGKAVRIRRFRLHTSPSRISVSCRSAS